MLGDFTEIISSKLVEIGLLDKPCRDLGINSKQGWNLGIKLDGLKKSILS